MKPSDSVVSRRKAIAVVAASMTAISVGCESKVEPTTSDTKTANELSANQAQETVAGGSEMKIHYLEVVTAEVDAMCNTYAEVLESKFGEPIQALGGARIALQEGGGMVGVRAPMHAGEKPVTRAYALVRDIQAAVAAAEKGGATIAVPPMKIEGYGECAIYLLGGIEAGFWQV